MTREQRLLDAARAVLDIHQPLDAVMFAGGRQFPRQVCTGCGQDDGNWSRYLCATVRAITPALEAANPSDERQVWVSDDPPVIELKDDK